MGITLFTNNAFSSVSDPDEYSPGFDVTSLRRAEIFTYTGIGKNLMPGEGGPTVVGTPTFITDSPFVQFSNNANVAHLNLGINDAAQQTWFLLFDPNNDSTQRIIAGSFSGTAASTPPGVSVIVDESGALAAMQGVHYTDTDTYGTARATLSAFTKTKPMLICLTLDGQTTRLTDMTNNVSASLTLATGRERAPAPFASVKAELHTGDQPLQLADLGLIWFSIAYYLMLRKLLFMTIYSVAYRRSIHH